MTKTTVIIATYNRGHLIGRALDSVLVQDVKDVEIIVVDDGSNDHTLKTIRNYGSKVIYCYQKNQGPASARNVGIRMASGEYITFLDSDDIYLPANIETKTRLLDEHPEIGWVFSDWYYADDKGKVLYKGSQKLAYGQRKLNGKIFEELVYNRNFITPGVVMARREVFDHVGLFDPAIPSLEDYELWLRISANYRVRYIDQQLVMVFDQNRSLSKDLAKWAEGNALIAEKIISIIPKDIKIDKDHLIRLEADKYTFLAKVSAMHGDYAVAIQKILRSIKCLPFQKKVYLMFAAYLYGLTKNYFSTLPFTESNKADSKFPGKYSK